MDVLSHTLWSNALYHSKYHNRRGMRYLSAFLGVAPDLVGFTPLFIYLIFSGRMFAGERFPFTPTNWTFGFAEHAYNYTHSLVIFTSVALLILLTGNIVSNLKRRKMAKQVGAPVSFKFWFFWPMLAWPFHIMLDIPTHPNFYHTPILFPLSDYKYTGGISWAQPMFMLVNAILLLSVYLILFYVRRKELRRTS